MKTAFEKAGINAVELAFTTALATYLGAGGTIQRAHEIIDIATRGMDHATLVRKDHTACVPPRGKPNHGERTTQRMFTRTSGALSVPREPSKVDVAAARKARGVAARSIWDRTIGGEVTLRGSTKHHWQTMVHKSVLIGHVARRMLTEINWPDDVTPLEKVATEKQVEAIFNSGYDALNSVKELS